MVLSERKIKWTLFGAMSFSLPVIYFLYLTGGFLPLVSIVAAGLQNGFFALAAVVHLLVYLPIFYFLSGAVARRLAVWPERARAVSVIALCVVMSGLTQLPVYQGPYGDKPRFTNLYDATACALRGSRAC
jgi:hypothetical protein